MPEKKTTTRRWLPRFGLRTLFLLVLVVAAGFGIYAWLLQDLHEQQAIESELIDLECKVFWDAEFRGWHLWADAVDAPREEDSPWWDGVFDDDPFARINARINYVECYPKSSRQLQAAMATAERLPYLELLCLDLYSESGPCELEGFRALPRLARLQLLDVKLNEESVTEISKMHQLTKLSFWDSELRPRDIGYLKDLTRLRELYFFDCGVTADYLPAISEIKSLEFLSMAKAEIDNRNLEFLQRLPKLRGLTLGGTQVNGAAIEKLAEIESLEHLYLWGTQISGDDILPLAKIPSLWDLELSGTDIGDEAVPILAEFPHIWRLRLAHTKISDDCIDDLIRFEHLVWLEVRNTNITKAGRDRLKEGLPNAYIAY